MSLRVDDGRSRGRSKSPGRKDERSRSRNASPAVIIQTKKSSKKYYSDESDSDTRLRKKRPKKHYDESSESDSDPRSKKKSSKKRYDSDESDSDPRPKRTSSKKHHDDSDSDPRSKRKSSRKHDESDSDNKPKKKSSKKRYSDSDSDSKSKKKFVKQHYDKSDSSSSSSEDDRRSKHKSSKQTRKDEHIETSTSKYERERHGSYASAEQRERPAEPKRHTSTSSIESGEKYRQLSMPGGFNGGHSPHPQYAQPQVISRPEGQRTHSGSISSRGPEYAKYQYADLSAYAAKGRKPSYTMSAQPQFVDFKPPRASHAPPSPPKLHRLSISGGGGLSLPSGHTQGGLPPGSPLLESYRGTWQSISPMPSPLMLPSIMDEGLSDLEQLSSGDSDDSGGLLSKKSTLRRKTVSFYDPEPDALALAAALKHSTPETKPIIKILPHLSDDHILMLRTEYKKHMKAQGKGVNIAKHIKMKITGNLGKVAYATALGRWESEAHWANFWYQSNTSRRELLIESLMGRTNSEIVKIKDSLDTMVDVDPFLLPRTITCVKFLASSFLPQMSTADYEKAFSDQRYNNSLEKCMQTELKKDKFRNAVLLALEEKRMSESEKLSIELVRRDAQDLYRALTAKEGGETAMINIIVVRSDKHLAEVLRVFESQYRKNFAREMIQKSRNLVGETLAHILNGVLNKPVRDALLLHQALAETSKDRIELLISRLVRFHWEPQHLERIKVSYKQRYGRRLESAIEEGTKGDFGDFCVALCKVES